MTSAATARDPQAPALPCGPPDGTGLRQPDARAIRVLLVDDHPLVRDGVRMRLQATPHIEVAGEAAGMEEALAQAAALQPDLVVTDIRMPDGSGIELAERFGQRFPAIKLVVLSMHSDQEYLRRALELGVAGYVLKDAPAQQLVQAIGEVFAGGRFFSPALSLPLDALAPVPRLPRGLTPREADVLAQISQGRSNKEIAAALGASIRTVETHRLHLRRKLQIEGRAELLRYAIEFAERDHLSGRSDRGS